MKTRRMNMKSLMLAIGLLFTGILAYAQQPAIQYFRPYDKRGINVYETSKEDSVKFDGLKVRFGAGFTQGYQNLKHSNGLPSTSTIKLYELGGGFPLAQANFNMDVQLADGVRLNLISYMSAHHHNEFWVKGGYFQIDKVGFLKSEFMNNLWKNLTLKVGHMEVNYGDAHFRRSDGGHTMWNPFIENNIMDAFNTEIGAELYWQKNGIIAMAAITDGEIQGNVLKAAPTGTFPNQSTTQRKPSIYGKLGYDKQVNEDLRVRLTGSIYTTKSSVRNTIFGGDRTGSNYQFVMDLNTATVTTAFTSGRFNPGYTDNVTAYMVNPFVKFNGLEVFGTWEYAFGKNNLENGEAANWGSENYTNRQSHQAAADLLYRFGKNEKYYIGARYMTLTSNPVFGQTATNPGALYDVTITRTAFGAGWFITPNVLFKGEYVNQEYDGFPTTDRFYQGKFNGVVVQGVIAF